MKTSRTRMLIFMALCCTLGLFTKKIINPFANIITDALHIPGGISTGFSIMFLVVAAELGYFPGSGMLMGIVQGLLALVMGRVGSMGIFMPIAYFMPGAAIDIIFYSQKYVKFSRRERMVLANAFAAVMASVVANTLVFRLWGPVLGLYLGISCFSGVVYGFLGSEIAKRLYKVIDI